ncbi:cytochrome P450 [Roseivivax halodurans JCM 10272]|uniref:Cytochrome P450 n=1 Tax=Roseivivax halodurans JCM 10272 TaxID=1449350 RepID=X7ED08_9RHOB|nr:cytochrome P450 [Roseivivax halodurans]ETX13944.1 cytochrome P450 [Roseivivax halodurans JCM 10272]
MPLDRPAPPVSVPLLTREIGILETLSLARRNALSIVPEAALTEPALSGKAGRRWHMLMDPEALKLVLKDRLDNYPKSVVTKQLLRPGLGESLFISEGSHWRWQRRTAAPAFAPRPVEAMGEVMTEGAERVCDRLDARIGAPANLYDEMVTVTLEVITAVTFSGDAGFDRDRMHRAINAYLDQVGRISLLDVLGAPDWVPRPGRLLRGGQLREMKAQADEAVELRRARGAKDGAPDLLDLLLAAEDPETERRMTTRELRDNLITFVVAGHETTALALSWALYLIGRDPERQARAREEARDVLGARAATAGDLDRLPYIHAVIDEAMRLYPSASLVSRNAVEADRLPNADVAAGDIVMMPIYALHRHHDLWSDPHEFRPERWLDWPRPDRYAYLPFIDGPRICIGARFAMQEAMIVLATLLARYRFTPVPGREPDPVMVITLRPQGGVWLVPERI